MDPIFCFLEEKEMDFAEKKIGIQIFFMYVKISKFNEKNLGNVFHSLLQFFKSTQFFVF